MVSPLSVAAPVASGDAAAIATRQPARVQVALHLDHDRVATCYDDAVIRRPFFAFGLALGLVVVASVACSSVPVVRYDDEDGAVPAPGTSSSTDGGTDGGKDAAAGDGGPCSPACVPPAQCCKNPGGKLGCFTNCQ